MIPAFAISLFCEVFGALWLVLTLIWLAVFLGLYLFYLPMHYGALSFKVEGNAIIQCGGVVYSYMHSLPVANIQYITYIVSPLDRAFGICSLAIAAPGGRIVISGLEPKMANELVSVLSGGESERS